MTEITLKDGRIFNSRFHDIKTAIDEISEYLFCEYGERIENSDVCKIETFSSNDVCNWLQKTHKLYVMPIDIKTEKKV